MDRVAVYIDADNISSSYADEIMKKAGEFGEIVLCRAYGNLSAFFGDKSWKDNIRKFSIQAFPQVNIGEKNNADFVLMLDALEDALTNNIAVICIVSSDSDYLPLVQKLRPRKMIYGFGEEKTPMPYRLAFVKFFVLGEGKTNENVPIANNLAETNTDETTGKTSNVSKPQPEPIKIHIPSTAISFRTPAAITPLEKTSDSISSPISSKAPVISKLTPKQSLLAAYEMARKSNTMGNDFCTKTDFGQKIMRLKDLIPDDLQCQNGLLAKLLKLEDNHILFAERGNGNLKLVSLSPLGTSAWEKEKDVIERILSVTT